MITDRSFAFPLRGIFDPTILRSLRSELRRLEAEEEAEQSARDSFAKRVGSANDRIRKRMDWYRIWEGLKPEHAQALHPFSMVTFPVQLRHLKNSDQLVPWHQDAGYMRLLSRRHERIITCWIPMDDNPTQHPTLCFPKKEEWTEIPHRAEDLHGATLELAPSEIVHWDLELGDCLAFGDHRPHRTLQLDHMNMERHSIEARLVREQDVLPGKDYYDIRRNVVIHTPE